VIPDHFRIERKGEVRERTPGLKNVAVRALPQGGTVEEEVSSDLAERLCLDDGQLEELHRLATRCEEVYGPARDIEWAFAGGRLYLLQCSAITRAGPEGPARSGAPVEVLGRARLFISLDKHDVEKIAALFKERRFAAGETVIKEGSGGDGLGGDGPSASAGRSRRRSAARAFTRVPADALPVVTTTWALASFPLGSRLSFLSRLNEKASGRAVAWVSVEGWGSRRRYRHLAMAALLATASSASRSSTSRLCAPRPLAAAIRGAAGWRGWPTPICVLSACTVGPVGMATRQSTGGLWLLPNSSRCSRDEAVDPVRCRR
jgi:Pyruvate phosphate dikinase, AMP/ATP-binding domain/Uncharacterized protein conserved in bacteria (DUF2332)